eukprot:jgi/Hompol1/4826/HPOL_003972-RA
MAEVTSVRRSRRPRELVHYSELGISPMAGDELKWTKILRRRVFADDDFKRMQGQDMTLDWVREHGLQEPIVFETPEGLDMQMPSPDLTVDDVARMCGEEQQVNCLEVSTQAERIMSLGEWADYFRQPHEQRRRILNVISLEISDSPLADQIQRPRIVRQLDWIDQIWPPANKVAEYPKVQLYCLMSVKDSYTDFHIDFGGTSVFYHILSGQKVFYFIEPTPANLKKYEKWSSSPDQATTFLGDEIRGGCTSVHLFAGNTMIIPTGWIHSVYTPCDSVVIGGNFLHTLGIKRQLDIHQIEISTNVPAKFRFPYYLKMHWFAGEYYAAKLQDEQISFTQRELDNLSALADFLAEQVEKSSRRGGAFKDMRRSVNLSIPSQIKDTRALVKQLRSALEARTRTALTGPKTGADINMDGLDSSQVKREATVDIDACKDNNLDSEHTNQQHALPSSRISSDESEDSLGNSDDAENSVGREQACEQPQFQVQVQVQLQ